MAKDHPEGFPRNSVQMQAGDIMMAAAVAKRRPLPDSFQTSNKAARQCANNSERSNRASPVEIFHAIPLSKDNAPTAQYAIGG